MHIYSIFPFFFFYYHIFTSIHCFASSLSLSSFIFLTSPSLSSTSFSSFFILFIYFGPLTLSFLFLIFLLAVLFAVSIKSVYFCFFSPLFPILDFSFFPILFFSSQNVSLLFLPFPDFVLCTCFFNPVHPFPHQIFAFSNSFLSHSYSPHHLFLSLTFPLFFAPFLSSFHILPPSSYSFHAFSFHSFLHLLFLMTHLSPYLLSTPVLSFLPFSLHSFFHLLFQVPHLSLSTCFLRLPSFPSFPFHFFFYLLCPVTHLSPYLPSHTFTWSSCTPVPPV